MKRDFELVRKILSEFEERDAEAKKTIAPKGYSNDEIRYHIDMMVEAGFIGMDEVFDGDRFVYSRASQLTWEGQNFLDLIRDDSQWAKIKKAVKEQGFSLTIDTIKMAASALIKMAFNIS